MDLVNRSGWADVKTTTTKENAENIARTNPVHCGGQQRLSTTSVSSRSIRDHANIQSTLFDGIMISGQTPATVQRVRTSLEPQPWHAKFNECE
jgi:hypothetical protein